jgi:hypothetical protein
MDFFSGAPEKMILFFIEYKFSRFWQSQEVTLCISGLSLLIRISVFELIWKVPSILVRLAG